MPFQLIYASCATRGLAPADVKALLHRSRHNNAAIGVTGALIVHGGQFLQLLEGAPSTVARLYQRILASPLHGQARLLDFSEIDRPRFALWAMGMLPVTGENRDLVFEHLGDALTNPLALDATGAGHLFDLLHEKVHWLS